MIQKVKTGIFECQNDIRLQEQVQPSKRPRLYEDSQDSPFAGRELHERDILCNISVGLPGDPGVSGV